MIVVDASAASGVRFRAAHAKLAAALADLPVEPEKLARRE